MRELSGAESRFVEQFTEGSLYPSSAIEGVNQRKGGYLFHPDATITQIYDQIPDLSVGAPGGSSWAEIYSRKINVGEYEPYPEEQALGGFLARAGNNNLLSPLHDCQLSASIR